MVLKVTNANEVKVYTVSGAGAPTSLPDWLARKRKKALRNDLEYSSRIELLQDFEFSEASNCIKVTEDGRFAMATGTYKPQIHVYEFSELGLKFDRHTRAENVSFILLSDDWTKSVHLQSDRTLEFHAQGGIHYELRIPRFGRSLAYHSQTCDVYVGAAGSEVYRFNLERGTFMRPRATNCDRGVNAVNVNPAHGLLSFGGADGTVEFWDPRTASCVATLSVNAHTGHSEASVTAGSFHENGLLYAAGTSTGLTLLFDLRSSSPLLKKDQGYGDPIKSLHFLDAVPRESRVLSADSTIIKIWDRLDGTPFTSIEPTVGINDVCPVPGSGMIFVANEGIPMHTYYVPLLGPSPSWCRFLDNVTEEMEENPVSTVYDNYKFVTRKELAGLGLQQLIGTNLVRSYMHGFFIDLRLYDKAKLIADPFMYEDHRKKTINEKIQKERMSRIRSAKPQRVKVNKGLAERLEKHSRRDAVDERFKEVFEDPDYEVNEETHEFQQLNPTRGPRQMTAAELSDAEEYHSESSS